MTTQEEQEIKDKLREILSRHPNVAQFLIDYNDYVHLIDDLIDGDATTNAENILTLAHKASKLFNNDFYRQFGQYLYLVEVVNNNTYADSVIWEKIDGWKKQHADVMRHAALDMFMACIFILSDYQTLRSISPKMREYCYTKHLNDFLCYDNIKSS
jgi:hypothetical protein